MNHVDGFSELGCGRGWGLQSDSELLSPLDQASDVQVEVWVVVIVTLQYGYGGALGFPSKGDGPLECVPLLGLGTGGELAQA